MAQRISQQELPDFSQLPDSSLGIQEAGAGQVAPDFSHDHVDNTFSIPRAAHESISHFALEPFEFGLNPFVLRTELWEDANLNGITDWVAMHLPEGPTLQNVNVIDNMLYLPLPYRTDQQGNQNISSGFNMQIPYVPLPLSVNGMTDSLPGPQVFTQYSISPQPLGRSMFQCNNCTATFTRDADRIRHENAKHRMVSGAYVCPIAACPKSQGVGYSRPDKLKEHLWKQHANLGYTKRT